MNGGTVGKAIGVSRKVQYYTKPSAIPIGIPKGSKVYKVGMKPCVINLIEPPYTEPYVRWSERSGVSRPLLLDCNDTSL